jgi:hypothetical protein
MTVPAPPPANVVRRTFTPPGKPEIGTTGHAGDGRDSPLLRRWVGEEQVQGPAVGPWPRSSWFGDRVQVVPAIKSAPTDGVPGAVGRLFLDRGAGWCEY